MQVKTEGAAKVPARKTRASDSGSDVNSEDLSDGESAGGSHINSQLMSIDRLLTSGHCRSC